MRLAKEKLGEDAEVVAISNCPVAVDLHVLPDQNGIFGTKIFFMKLQYLMGDIKLTTDAAKYGWLDRDELVKSAEIGEGENAGKFYRYML